MGFWRTIRACELNSLRSNTLAGGSIQGDRFRIDLKFNDQFVVCLTELLDGLRDAVTVVSLRMSTIYPSNVYNIELSARPSIDL